MLILNVIAPFSTNRKFFSRAFGESYDFPTISCVYGCLLSMAGEFSYNKHVGVKFGFAYKTKPEKSVLLKNRHRFKYGNNDKALVAYNSLNETARIESLVPEYSEVLTNINMLVGVDSSSEINNGCGKEFQNLEQRIVIALTQPELITRIGGCLALGCSDDMVDMVKIMSTINGKWHKLVPNNKGRVELPICSKRIDGSGKNIFQRYDFKNADVFCGFDTEDMVQLP